MAQRSLIILQDDIDGTRASETITFSRDGVGCESGLNDKISQRCCDFLSVRVGRDRRESGHEKALVAGSQKKCAPGELSKTGEWACQGCPGEGPELRPTVIIEAWEVGDPSRLPGAEE